MRKGFSSNAKYRPCACVYHNNKTPSLKKKINPLPLTPVDLSYLDRVGIQTRGTSHKYYKQSQFHCSLPAEYIRRLRYCDYLGKYFCDCCHSYAQSSIPARILLKWDFKKYYVCNFSKHLLDSIWQHPIFNVSCINKALYTKSKEMDRVRVSVAVFLLGICGSETFGKNSLGQIVFCRMCMWEGGRVGFSAPGCVPSPLLGLALSALRWRGRREKIPTYARGLISPLVFGRRFLIDFQF